MPWQLQYRRYSLEFRSPVRTGRSVWPRREGLLLRLTSETGRVGYGEAAPVPGFGKESVSEDEEAVRRIGESPDAATLSQVPGELGCLRRALAAAMEGVASRGSASGPSFLPVAGLLPPGRAAIQEAREKAEAGFRVFKWKVGVGDVDEEIGLMDELFGALPGGSRLRLDANGSWDRKRAERWLARCDARRVEFVEQPVAHDSAGSEDLLLGLAADYPVPLALDESLAGDGDIARWMDAGWPGVFVLKPSLTGDIEGAMSRLAKANASVVFSSALETPVGAQSALRAAFAWSAGKIGESPATPAGGPRAVGFGVWPLFADTRFNALAPGPFIYREQLESIDPEATWNALS